MKEASAATGAGGHDYTVLYTEIAAQSHGVQTTSTPITQTSGNPPVTVITGYDLQIAADFSPTETARIAGGVKLAVRAEGATSFGPEIEMDAQGANGFETTLDNLPDGQYEVRLSYTDVDGNEVVADWITVSASANGSFANRSQTVLARETGGSYMLNAHGLPQVSPGLYTGAIDADALAAALSLQATATGQPAGAFAADGSTTGYFVETRYNALNAKVASNEQDGLWRFYGVDGNGNAVQTRLVGTQDDLATPASGQPQAVSYAAFDARNRKTAEFAAAFTVHGESAARHAVTRTEYDALDQVVARTDALGNTTRSEYNGAGIQIRQIDPYGHGVTIKVDALGNETATIDQLGHTSTKFHDSLGRLVREVDATGHETQYTYDVFDRRVTVTDGLGALSAQEGDHSTRFAYDQRDRLVKIELAQGWHLANDSDPVYAAERERLGYAADVTTLTSQQKAELAALYVQSAAYDGRNNRTLMVDANGHATRQEYDALGRVTDTITLQNGTEIHERRQYDAYGNLIAEIDGDGRSTSYRYAGFARLVEEIDAGGIVTSTTYDHLGNRIRETSSAGKHIERGFDSAGNLLSITDFATGVSTVFGYTILGQRAQETITTPEAGQYGAHNRAITYGYDALGRQTRWSDAVTGAHLNYDWDAAGNQKRVTTDAGYAHAVDHRYRYDAANRVLGIDKGDGSVIAAYTYDAAGNRISYNNGTDVAAYTYDSLNRVVKGVQGDKTSVWEYDRVGNVLKYVDAEGKVSTYQYFENNRNWHSTSGEQETTMELNLAGNVTQMTLRNAGKTYYYTYTYHADGREASIRGYGAASGNSVSEYDVNNNRTSVNRGKGDGMDRAEISTFVTSNEGKILFSSHDDGKSAHVAKTEYLYANGHQVGETGTDNKGENKTELDVGRYNLVQNIDGDWPGTAVTTYTANEGDTLQSIAAAVYGNPSLWYLIADANGLSPNERIKAGTDIKIPTTARTGALTADAHRVYNEADILGSTLPNLQSPPPKKKGCAMFLMIIVVIIVAVVAWWAIGQLGPMIGAALGGGTAGGLSATALAAVNLAGYAIAGAIVGAAASIITQGFAIALGLQEKFSWKAVAAGAISGIFSGAAQGVGALAQAGKLGEFAQYAKVASAALRVTGAATQQFIQNGKITSWASLAAAGLQGYLETGAAQAKALGDAAKTAQRIEKAVEAAKQITELQRVVSYVSPWIGLAETAVRNDGKLKSADWANAVGATLGTALSTGDIGADFMKGFEPGTKYLVGNLLVGGAMSAISRSAGRDYLINAAAHWVGDPIGQSIGQALIGSPYQRQLAGAGAVVSSGSSGGGVAMAGREPDERYSLAYGMASNEGLTAGGGEGLRLGGYRASGDAAEGDQLAALGGDTRSALNALEREMNPGYYESVAGGSRVAKAGDSISKLIGASDPQAVGNFMRANNLTDSTIYAGRTYFIPDDRNAYGDNARLGQYTLNADNARLAELQLRTEAEAANEQCREMNRFASMAQPNQPEQAGTNEQGFSARSDMNAYWRDAESSSNTFLGAYGSRLARYAGNAGYEIGEGLHGMYRLATDGEFRGQVAQGLVSGAQYVINNPGAAADQVADAAAGWWSKPFDDKVEDIATGGIAALATMGTGKLAQAGGKAALKAADDLVGWSKGAKAHL